MLITLRLHPGLHMSAAQFVGAVCVCNWFGVTCHSIRLQHRLYGTVGLVESSRGKYLLLAFLCSSRAYVCQWNALWCRSRHPYSMHQQ